jgi:hypothetical protein
MENNDSSYQYDSNSNYQYDTNSNYQYDINSNYQYDTNSNYQYDTNSNYQYDTNSNYQYDTNSNYQYDTTNSNYQYDTNSSYQFDSSSNYQYDSSRDTHLASKETEHSTYSSLAENPTDVVPTASTIISYSKAPTIQIGPVLKPTRAVETLAKLSSVPLPQGYKGSSSSVKVGHSVHQPKKIDDSVPMLRRPKVINKEMSIRAAGGEIWEDKSMAMWDPSIFY